MPPQFHFPSPFSGPTHEQIAQCAYLIWEHEGRPQGRDQLHWEQARAQLIACREHDLWLGAWQSLLEGLGHQKPPIERQESPRRANPRGKKAEKAMA